MVVSEEPLLQKGGSSLCLFTSVKRHSPTSPKTFKKEVVVHSGRRRA